MRIHNLDSHTRRSAILAACFCVLGIASGTTAAEPLRYRIAPDQVVHYELKITVDTPSAVETLTGVIRYTGLKAEEDNFTVLYEGGLDMASRSKGTGSSFGSIGGRSQRGLTQTRSSLVVGTNGLVRKMQGDSQLPMMLGNLSMFPFEQFPPDDKKTWTVDGGILLTTKEQSQETTSIADEKAVYEITSEDGDLVEISREYWMRFPAATKEDLDHNIGGKGSFAFNRKLGVSERFDVKQTLTVSHDNVTITIPMTIHWHRMDRNQIADHEKRQAEKEAARIREETKYERAVDPEGKKKSMAALRSSDWRQPYKLLVDMRRSIRKELLAEDVDVAVQIGVLRAHENQQVRDAADVIWRKWGAAVEKHGSAEDKTKVAAAVAKQAELNRMAAVATPVVPASSPANKPERHRWTDRRGRLIVEGQFVRLDRSRVIIRDADGKEVAIVKPRLSKEDQALVDELAKASR